jgi:CheY-like chemotaxis protein
MPRPLILLALLLTGCATPPCPPPEVIEIPVTIRVTVPESLTEPCSVTCDIVTNGELLECYQKQKQALAACDARMGEIRGLE